MSALDVYTLICYQMCLKCEGAGNTIIMTGSDTILIRFVAALKGVG